MDAQELQGSEKVSAIWTINPNSIVNKMNNTKLSMIGMKLKYEIKLYFVKVDRSEIYTKHTI